MDTVALIRRKRDGGSLSRQEIQLLVQEYVAGRVADYQMSAFLMAAFLRGMNDAETGALLEAMLRSGEVLTWDGDEGTRVDKHSTGGVGDKVSLVLAPLAAACGLQVPMISGRGLGHTGGTLDKLESIPGFRTGLSTLEMRRQLDAIGVVMLGQTEDIAPADRKMYALRDVTATVEFIPFIAASIMSKKLAAGLDGLVLDVKTGDGAFMTQEGDARRLAEALVSASESYGCPAVARLTRMDAPLGRTSGNWPEVHESIQCLKGQGPADLRELTLCLTAEMLVLGKLADSYGDAHSRAQRALDDGSGMERFTRLVEAQGGDTSVLEQPLGRSTGNAVEVRAPQQVSGSVTAISARSIGEVGVQIGAGRARKEDNVDPLAGIHLNKLVGDPVEPGSVLATLHGSDAHRLAESVPQLLSSYRIGDESPPTRALLIDRFAGGMWSTEPSARKNPGDDPIP